MSNEAPKPNLSDPSETAADASAVPRPQPPSPLLLEVAWEVCSKVGGIYTVLRSKAPATVSRWGDQYCAVGPYREASARVEFEPRPTTEPFKSAIEQMAASGLRMHYGRWLISGRPQVVLVDVGSIQLRLAQVKYHLWKDNGIGSPDGDREFDEIALFGHAVAEFLGVLRRRMPNRPLLAHFHEWQGGAALPILRHRGTRVATVFTTHATLVGRNLSASNADLYGHLAQIDAGRVALEHGFAHRHALEGAAARTADVFTTVSGITALESAHFLGRSADVLLPNGLNVERFAAPHEFQVLHRENKERIHEFVMGHFFPSYTFDLDKTVYVFTAGRYEYRNKGLDVFIETLYQLNERMKAEGSATTVVAFIVTRAPYRALNVETLNRQAMFNELRDTCDAIKEKMGRQLFHTVAHGHVPSYDDLIDENTLVRLKRMLYAWRSSPLPTIVTHDLYDDAHDPVLQHLRHRQLLNMPDDRVKVVFHPEFVSATSPLLALEYDDFVRGCHLGFFPSYYEPWGYTPLECVVSGVPAISSDLSGFGDYVLENFPDYEANGMFVAPRRRVPFADTVARCVNWLHDLTRMNRRERIALRNRAESHAEQFDWKNLGRHYVDAWNLALRRHDPARGVDLAAPAVATPAAARAPVVIESPRPKRPARRRGTGSRNA